MSEAKTGKKSSLGLNSVQTLRSTSQKPHVLSYKGRARKTYSQKPADVIRKWYVLDASEAPLGRLATKAASLLLGKGKATVTPHTDGGDHVIVINAAHLVVTGNKAEGKIYYRHSGYPGGIYQRTLTEQLQKDPTEIIRKAIYGMLPVNKLRDGRLARLKIYVDENHNHNAQKPVTLSMKGNK